MTNLTIPDWYANPAPAIMSTEVPVRNRAGRAVRGALASIGASLAKTLSGPIGHESWMSRLEPRAKILGVVGLIVGATLIHGLVPLAVLLIIAISLAISARVKFGGLARIWFGVPMFSLAIILPAITNLVTPGDVAFNIWHVGQGVKIGQWILPESITVTYDGLVVGGRFLLRTMDCVTLAFLLVATTEHAMLLNGLRRLGMPRAFGMVLTMTHRYVAVLLRSAEEIHLAKLSRTITAGSVRHEQKWVAAGIGILFRRTHRLSQEVYHAMVSRGYDGDLRTMSNSRVRLSDILWLIGAAGVTILLILGDRLMGG